VADTRSGTARRTGRLPADQLAGGFPASCRDLMAHADEWIAGWEREVAVATESVQILALWRMVRAARRLRRVRDELAAMNRSAADPAHRTPPGLRAISSPDPARGRSDEILAALNPA
jgi:hypothetical protein